MKFAPLLFLFIPSTYAAPPVFTLHPVDAILYDGQNFTANVNTADTTATFQWRKDGVNLDGQTAKSLVLNPVTAAHEGDYDCVMTNVDGSSTHPPAHFRVRMGVAPVLRTAPLALQPVAGHFASMTASAVGSPPLTYQWLKDDVEIPGATSGSFSFSSPTPADNATYTVRATNSYGSTTGAPYIVRIVPIQPANICGVPLVKIADTHTIKPGRPGVKFSKFSKPKLRDGILYFLAQDGDPFEYGVYRWQNGEFSIVADETITAPDGTPFIDCRYPTEETGGSMAFGARTGSTIAGNSLVIYNASAGTHTQVAKYGDAAPGSGRFYGFGQIAKRGSTVYWAGLTFDPGRLAAWKWDGTTITEEFSDTTVLPGGGTFMGVPGDNPQFAFDGNFLTFGASLSGGAGGVYVKPAADGAITRIWNAGAPHVANAAQTYGYGVPDLDGGSVFIGGERYLVTVGTDGSVISPPPLSIAPRSVDACGPDSYLRYTLPGSSFDLELVAANEARRMTNATTLTTLSTNSVVAFGAPVPNAITGISGHSKSAAVTMSHPQNSQDVTDSLWLAHNSDAAASAPVITWAQPSVTANAGFRQTLRVIATGGGLTWAWRRNGVIVPGNENGDMVLNPFIPADHAGTWTVTVSNTLGSTEATFTLSAASVATAPVILGEVLSRSAVPGMTVSLSVAGLIEPGGGVLSYQWYRDGTPIPGATQPAYSISQAQPSASGHYYLVITNVAGSATSNIATVTVGNGYPPAPAPLTIVQNGASLDITFRTVNARSYRLEETTALNGGWTTVETFNGSGAVKSWSIPAGTGRRFYRVVDVTP